MTIYRTAAPRSVVGALFCAGLCAFISGSVAGGPSGGDGTEGGAAPDRPDPVSLVGIVRDFQPSPEHPDFDVTPGNGYGHYCGNIALELDDDGKPVCVGGGFRVSREWRDSSNRIISWNLYNSDLGDSKGKRGSNNDNGAITSAETFSEWYRDIPGVNLSRLHTITLEWDDDDDLYSFKTNNFTPIDDQLFGNGGYSHNYHFTYEIVARFTYDASAGQMLWFKGDDDCWVFIDGRLVIDHGGIAGSRQMHVDFDRLGLEDGEVYRLHLFHAERHQPQSHFRLKTNVRLQATFPPSILAMFD